MKFVNAVKYFFEGLFYNLKVGFLWIFGKIRVYPWPMFIVFDPRGYKVNGRQIRKALALVKPGDILVRRYVNYIDGYFIPGRFSHSAIYADATGGIVVHAMGDGVQKIDLIDFLRCDGFAILRPNDDVRQEAATEACRIALSYVGRTYDYDFDICEDYRNKAEVQKRTRSVYCHELTRSCYPDLDIPTELPSLWNGMIRSSKRQFLAQSFFDSPDLHVVFDSDYSEPICLIK